MSQMLMQDTRNLTDTRSIGWPDGKTAVVRRTDLTHPDLGNMIELYTYVAGQPVGGLMPVSAIWGNTVSLRMRYSDVLNLRFDEQGQPLVALAGDDLTWLRRFVEAS